MKFIENTEAIIGSDDSKSNKFKIMTSPKAYKILSNSLYKNKIRAVARELLTNVTDAHKLNGTKERFIVKAPTKLDPRFIVRDFGPGLDDDDMNNLYSVYFASTKNSSNDFTGAFGLGSKSPFSYTETFNVTSYHNGKVNGYVALMDSGEPALKHTFTDDMKEDEKTGIEIVVPVKIDDIQKWHQELLDILRTFKKWNPDARGLGCDIDYFPETSKDYFVLDTDFNYQGLYALYGGIVYPISEIDDIPNSVLLIDHRAVFVKFDMGDLDITPSREELSYDDETKNNIIKKLSRINNEILANEIVKLNKIDNERELLRYFREMMPDRREILFSSGYSLPDNMSYFDLSEKYKVSEDFAAIGVTYPISYDTKVGRIKYRCSGYGRAKGKTVNYLYGVHNSVINILIDDKPSNRLKVIRGMAAEGKSGDIVVFRADSPAEMDMIPKIQKLFAGDKVNIYTTSKCKNFVDKAPAASTVRSSSSKSKNIHIVELDTDISKNSVKRKEDYYISSSEIDKLEGFTIIKKRDIFYTFPGGLHIRSMTDANLHKICQVLGIDKINIIRGSILERCKKNKKLKSLYEEITNRYIELLDKVDYDEYQGDYSSVGSYNNRHFWLVVSQSPEFSFINDKIQESKNPTDGYERLNSIKHINISVKNSDKLVKARAIFNELNRYSNVVLEEKINKFAEEEPVVYYTIYSRSTFPDYIIENIKEILNCKNESKENK